MKIKISWILVAIIIGIVGCASSSTDTSSDDISKTENELFDDLKAEANSIEDSEKAADQLDSKFSSTERNEEELADTSSSKPSIDEIEKANSEQGSVATQDAFANLEKTENGMYYYVAIGGEMPIRLANGIYGNKQALHKIYEMNPALKDIKNVDAGVKIYFDMAEADPRSEYLTKDMLLRYKEELLVKIQNKRKRLEGNSEMLQLTVQKGDTLQTISQNLYGTVRMWTELFILNQDKVSNFDTLKPGITISYYPVVDFMGSQRMAGAIPVNTPSESVAKTNESPEQLVDDLNQQNAPVEHTPPTAQASVKEVPHMEKPSVNTQDDANSHHENAEVAGTTNNPIVKGGIPVDTDSEKIDDVASNKISENTQQAASQPSNSGELKRIRPQAEDIASDDESFFSKNIRRFIYIGFIALIIIGGYFMTRPSSGIKKNKFAGIQPMPASSSSSSGLGSRGRINRSGSNFDEKKTG